MGVRRRVFVVILLAGLVAILASPHHGLARFAGLADVTAPADIYVDATWSGLADGTQVTGPQGQQLTIGNDAFATVASGLGATGQGSSVHVAAGSYTETGPLTVSNQDEQLLGAGSGTTTVTLTGATPELRIDNEGTVVAGLSLVGDGTWDTTTHTFTSPSGDPVVLVPLATSGVVIRNDSISDGQVGVEVDDSWDNVIQNDELFHDVVAVQLDQGSKENTVSSNDMHDNGDASGNSSPVATILLEDSSQIKSTGNTVSGNTISNSVNHGISVRNSGNTISGNTISNSGTNYPLFKESSGIEVAGGPFDSDHNTITGNTITGSAFAGIKIGFLTDQNIVTRNTITGTLNGGANGNLDPAAGGSAVLLTANGAMNTTIADNVLGPNSGYGVAEESSTGSAHNAVNRNIISGNSLGGVHQFGSNNVDATSNWWGAADGPSGAGPGSGDAVNANVLFDSWLTSTDCIAGEPCGYAHERVAPDLTDAFGGSDSPSVSADGSRVAFRHEGTDLMLEDYVWDRASKTTEIVSTPDGTAGTDGSVGPPALSGDGRHVAFWSSSTDLTGDANPNGGIFVRNLDSETNVRVDGNLCATWRTALGFDPDCSKDPSNPDAAEPPVYVDQSASISGDGTRVVFGATDSHTNHQPGLGAVFLVDLATGKQTLVYTADPTTYNGEPQPTSGLVSEPTISEDGSTIAFIGETPGATSTLSLLSYDVASGVTTPLLTEGPDVTFSAEPPELSLDGRYVAVGLQTGASSEVVDVIDAANGHIDTSPEIFPAVKPWALSADGRHLVFFSHGTKSWDRLTGNVVTAVPSSPSTPSVDLTGDVVGFYGPDGIADPTLTGYGVNVAVRATSGDTTAPDWASGSTLGASNVGEDSLDLHWTPATDDRGVDHYALTVNGAALATVPATTFGYHVTGLVSGTDYSFGVKAVDGAGNSSDGPTTEVTSGGGTGSAPLAITTSTGGTAHLSWPASSLGDLSGYRILRGPHGGTLSPIGDVGPGQTAFVDSGLAADTSYDWQVLTIESGGSTSPYTVVQSAATPPLQLSAVVYSVPETSGTAVLGSDLAVVVRAEPNRTASAVLRYTDDAGAESASLALTPVGTTYRGTFHLATGISAVTEIDGTLSDGAGHTASASAAAVPLEVSGRLDVTYSDPLGFLRSPAITGSSAARGSGNTIPAPTAGTYQLSLAAASDYAVKLVESTGRVAATAGSVAVTAGHVSTLTLTPTYVSEVSAKVVDENGDPVAGAPVVAAVGGDDVGSGTTRSDGTTPILVEVPGGTDVTLTAKVPGQLPDASTTADVTASLGPDQHTIALHPLPTGTLAGLVARSSGAPVPGATVRVSDLTDDGREWSYTTTAGSDGHYSVAVFAGTATLTAYASPNSPGPQKTVTVAAASETDADLVAGPQPYVVHLSLFTQYAGESVHGPLPLNWSVAIHFSMGLTVGGVDYQANSGIVAVTGNPGQTVTFCADGFQAQLPSGCVHTTLGDSPDVQLSLTLSQEFSASAHLEDAQGGDWAGPWEAIAYQPGTEVQVASATGLGARAQVGLPAAGSYDLRFFTFGPAFGSASVSVSDSAPTADAGAIELKSGPLFSVDGNSIVASRSSAPTGGMTEVRLTYENDGSSTAAGAVARVAVPAGTELAPNSVTLDGSPVTPVTGPGYADVPLGDVASGAVGEVRYELTLTGDAGQQLPVTAELRYAGTSEWLGPALLTVEGVTLDAAKTTTTLQIPVSGRAPPGATVSIFDGQTMIGQADSSDAGYWSSSVTLVDRGPQPWHDLTAATGSGAGVQVSEHAFVDYDPRLPQLTNVTLTQDGFLTYSFDPRDGVAHFPIVWSPSYPALQVVATFDHPDQVSNVQIAIGGDVEPATKNSDGTYTATMTDAPQGPIYVDYDAVPAPATPQPSTQAELQNSLAPGFDGYQVLPPAPGQPPDSANSASIDVSLPAVSATLKSTFAWTPNVEYTPTPADLAFQQQSGVPVYGLSLNASPPGSSFSTEVTGYIPMSAVSSAGAAEKLVLKALGARSGGITAPSGGPSADNPSPQDVYQFVMTAVLTASSEGETICPICGIGGIADAFGAGEKYKNISGLLDKLDTCSTADANAFRGKIDTLEDLAAGEDVVTGAFAVIGLVGAPETFGASLLFNVASGLIGAAIDSDLDEEITLLGEQIDVACPHPTPPDPPSPPPGSNGSGPGSPVGNPTWIYDPSGYVYEAVDGNRVSGVTATLEQGASSSGPWTIWDGAPFGQVNPETTDADGSYGWDVPQGWWRVVFTKPGYETATSRVVQVLPPHTDMNVAMVSLRPPTVSSIGAWSAPDGGSVDVTFDTDMLASSIGDIQIAVTGADGNPVAGHVAPVDPQTDVDGNEVATTFRFVPDAPLTQGDTLSVAVDASAQSYAGVLLAGGVQQDVTVGGTRPVPPPPTQRAPFSPNPQPTVPFVAPLGDFLPPAISSAPDVSATTHDPSGKAVSYTEPTAVDVHDGPVPVSCSPASGSVFPVGTTSVTCSATDAAGNADSTQFRVTVTRVDQAPAATADSYSVAEGESLSVPAPGVLGNDADPDSDAITAVLGSGPAHGTLTLNANGSFAYKPSAGFSGQDSFSYLADDGSLRSAPATVTIAVSPVTASRSTALVYTGPAHAVFGLTTLTTVLSGQASHAGLGGEVVIFAIDGGAPHAATTNGSGTASYTPAFPLAPGVHSIAIAFAGDAATTGSSATGSLRIVDSASGTATGAALRPSTGGRADFHLVAKRLTGKFTYRKGALRFSAKKVTAFGIAASGKSAWFAGVDRRGRVFLAYVADKGKAHGKRDPDVFELWIRGRPQTGQGALRSGSISIRRR